MAGHHPYDVELWDRIMEMEAVDEAFGKNKPQKVLCLCICRLQCYNADTKQDR